MSPRCIPASPTWRTDSERAVWETLRTQAGDDWTIVANQVLADGEREYEIDLLVLIPDQGIVALEVKGGEVWIDAHTGRWQQKSHGETKRIDPVGQVLKAKFAARDYVEDDPRWSRGRLRWGHGIVLPHSKVAEGFALPGCPRSQVHGRDDLDELAGRIWGSLRTLDHGLPAPTDQD